MSGQADMGQEKGMARPPSDSGNRAKPAARGVPDAVRATLLAHIHYPWLARRMGWTGRVLIGFRVQDRRLNEVHVLESSGHDALDRAAMRGISGVRRIALTDGDYRLPVRFVLQ